MQMSESILFTRHLVAGDYTAAFKLTGIEWDIADFNCPESQILNDADIRFGHKITDFFKENGFLFDEYDESIKKGFKAYIPQYLLEHPVRKMLLKVMRIKAIAVPPSPITIDLSHLSKEQIEMLKKDIKEVTAKSTDSVVMPQKTNDPAEAVSLAANVFLGSERQYPLNPKHCTHFSTTLFFEGKAECFGCGAVVNTDRELIEVENHE
ncbi:hypothetical protein [Acinetobacter sp. CFCC 10889]|uniref:hypothetical protein n=1 Tax=Acinetobacter sp. CFCC 10889 TaxID=1775557 RepID=UPI000DCFA297|nr:hypothetical protein [Acinetobacter sp. CFCC 10889]